MCKRVMAISSWLIIIMFWAMFSPQFVPTMPTIGFNVDGAKKRNIVKETTHTHTFMRKPTSSLTVWNNNDDFISISIIIRIIIIITFVTPSKAFSNPSLTSSEVCRKVRKRPI
jgi:hypothetical protein